MWVDIFVRFNLETVMNPLTNIREIMKRIFNFAVKKFRVPEKFITYV